jgi:uncharacterized repeat protein (TIGR01451 family)
MRVSKQSLLLVVALAAGACSSSGSGKGMTRPDLGPGYEWAGGAIPTGDMKTSVLTLEKIVPSYVETGRDYEYTIRVANISKTTALENVVVSDDTKGSGFLISGSQPPAQNSNGMLSWNLGGMKPGSTAQINVSGHAGPSSHVPSCASVTYKEVAPPTPPTVVAPPAPVQEAKLELTKTVPAEACAGEDIPIRLVVKNTGKGEAKDVRVTDELPDGWTVNGQKSAVFNVGNLAAGASKELTARARSSRSGKFVNHATATGAGGLSSTSSSVETSVHKSVLELTKIGPKSAVILGRPATYTITVKNTGDGPAENFTIKDTITGADTVGPASDGGVVSGSTVTWNLGTLAAGASRTVTVDATRSTAGSMSDTATATSRCADAVSSSAVNSAFIGVPAVLTEVLDNPDPVLVGSTTTYTIKVTNTGTAPDSEIAVTCTFEDAVAFVSASGVTKGTNTGNNVNFAPLATLKPKEVAIWTVVVKGLKAADTRFKVVVNTHETGRPIETNEATRVYE